LNKNPFVDGRILNVDGVFNKITLAEWRDRENRGRPVKNEYCFEICDPEDESLYKKLKDVDIE